MLAFGILRQLEGFEPLQQRLNSCHTIRPARSSFLTFVVTAVAYIAIIVIYVLGLCWGSLAIALPAALLSTGWLIWLVVAMFRARVVPVSQKLGMCLGVFFFLVSAFVLPITAMLLTRSAASSPPATSPTSSPATSPAL